MLRAASVSRHDSDLVTGAFDYAAIGMAIVALDGRWLKVNRALCEMLGYTDEELLCTDSQSITHPDDLTLNYPERLLAGELQAAQVEKRYCHKNGTIVWGQLHITLAYDSRKLPMYFVAQIQDISKRKQVEEELRQSEESMRLLLEALSHGIMLINEAGIVVEANAAACELMGIERGKLRGMHTTEYPYCFYRETGEYIAPSEFPSQISLTTGKAVRNMLMSYTSAKTDQQRWLLVNSQVLQGVYTDEAKKIVVSFVDITERKQTEELLRKAEKLSTVGHLASGVAHEIRNPLTTVKGFVQLLQSGITAKPEYYQIMLEEVQRIEMIIGEFIVLAAPHALHFKEHSLRDIMQVALDQIRDACKAGGIEVRAKFVGKVPEIYCEENQLIRLFVNLLRNAAESMPDGGTIYVEVLAREEDVIIRIVDQGCGIPEDSMNKLGEPFFTTKENRTGLGLVVSHRILRDHQGSMHIKSRLQHGTAVEIRLPAATKQYE